VKSRSEINYDNADVRFLLLQFRTSLGFVLLLVNIAIKH